MPILTPGIRPTHEIRTVIERFRSGNLVFFNCRGVYPTLITSVRGVFPTLVRIAIVLVKQIKINPATWYGSADTPEREIHRIVVSFQRELYVSILR